MDYVCSKAPAATKNIRLTESTNAATLSQQVSGLHSTVHVAIPDRLSVYTQKCIFYAALLPLTPYVNCFEGYQFQYFYEAIPWLCYE